MQKKRFCKNLAIFLLMVSTTLPAFAQGKKITGTVNDGSGEPVVGATIVEKETAGNGTSTDMNGKFSLTITPRGKTIVASFLGMKSKEILIEGKSTFNITLH